MYDNLYIITQVYYIIFNDYIKIYITQKYSWPENDGWPIQSNNWIRQFFILIMEENGLDLTCFFFGEGKRTVEEFEIHPP